MWYIDSTSGYIFKGDKITISPTPLFIAALLTMPKAMGQENNLNVNWQENG